MTIIDLMACLNRCGVILLWTCDWKTILELYFYVLYDWDPLGSV